MATPSQAPQAQSQFLVDAVAGVLNQHRELFPPDTIPRSDARSMFLGEPFSVHIDRCVYNRHANRYVVEGHCSACQKRFITSVPEHKECGIHMDNRVNWQHSGVPFKLPPRGLLGVRVNPAPKSFNFFKGQ